MTPSHPIYILASNYIIAKSIFRELVRLENRPCRLYYISDPDSLRGLRGITVVVSSERFPSPSFYDRFDFLIERAKLGYLGFMREELYGQFQKREAI